MPNPPTFNKWVTDKHHEINNAIADCFAKPTGGAWEENTITAAVLAALGEADDLEWEDRPQRVRWKTCKLVGENEQKRGDIALRVRVLLSKNTYVTGVAFYEAKRAFYDEGNTGQFRSIEQQQLARLSSFAGADHQILLYRCAPDNQSKKFVGSARVVPLPFVKAHKDAGRVRHQSLPNQGMHLMEVLSRHLLGFHLDTREEALAAFEQALGHYQYVIAGEVSMSKGLAPALDESWNAEGRYISLDSVPDLDVEMPEDDTEPPEDGMEPNLPGSKI